MKVLKWAVAATCGSIAIFAALNWQGLVLASAIGSSESRPALLADAEWDDPSSSKSFNSRFSPGTKTSDLLAWLESNDFKMDDGRSRAMRKIQSLPCNERVQILWEADRSGLLTSAQAVVSEAGCL